MKGHRAPTPYEEQLERQRKAERYVKIAAIEEQLERQRKAERYVKIAAILTGTGSALFWSAVMILFLLFIFLPIVVWVFTG